MSTRKVGSLVLETTDTTGTGTLTLNGAETGFQSFIDSGNISSGDSVLYYIRDSLTSPTLWEFGVGTITAGASDTLSRDTVLGSSNSGSKVNLTGTNYVFSQFVETNLFAFTDTGIQTDVLTLSETTAPATASGEGALYTVEVSSARSTTNELYFRGESNASPIRITNGGKIVGGLQYQEAASLASVTTVDVSIHSEAELIICSFYNVRDGAGSTPIIQLGVSAADVLTSTYRYSITETTSSGSNGVNNSNSGNYWPLASSWGPTDAADGGFIIQRTTGNNWVIWGIIGNIDGLDRHFTLSGRVELSTQIQNLRFTTASGSGQFNSGVIEVNVVVE